MYIIHVHSFICVRNSKVARRLRHVLVALAFVVSYVVCMRDGDLIKMLECDMIHPDLFTHLATGGCKPRYCRVAPHALQNDVSNGQYFANKAFFCAGARGNNKTKPTNECCVMPSKMKAHEYFTDYKTASA